MSSQMSEHAELIDLSRTPPLRAYVSDAWSRRAYAIEVPLAEYRSQNLHTALGQLWHLLNPALQMSIYFLVFGVILDTDRGIENFLMFLGAGLFSFRFCESSAVKGATALTANIGLIRSIRFPRVLLPLSSTFGQILAQGTILVILAILALVTGEGVRWQWVLMAPTLLLQSIFCFGLACWTARYAYQWPDLPNLLPFLFRLLFYMSGVLYSIENFIDNELVLRVFAANPFYVFIELWRFSFLDGSATSSSWVTACGWAAISAASGISIFRRAEGTYGQG